MQEIAITTADAVTVGGWFKDDPNVQASVVVQGVTKHPSPDALNEAARAARRHRPNTLLLVLISGNAACVRTYVGRLTDVDLVIYCTDDDTRRACQIATLDEAVPAPTRAPRRARQPVRAAQVATASVAALDLVGRLIDRRQRTKNDKRVMCRNCLRAEARWSYKVDGTWWVTCEGCLDSFESQGHEVTDRVPVEEDTRLM